MRFVRRSAWTLVAALVALAVVAILTRRAGDPDLFPPKPEEPGVTVYVTAYSYHSGLVLPLAELRLAADTQAHGELVAIADRFSAYPFVEIGWGDEGFYRLVPTLAQLTAVEAVRALFRPGNPSVLHVVGFAQAPIGQWPGVEVAPVKLSPEGFRRLVGRLAASVATEDGRPVELGAGLYGPSLFYRARGTFSILRVCNHWVGELLNTAGVPTLPVLDTLPVGLLVDLRWEGAVPASSEDLPRVAR